MEKEPRRMASGSKVLAILFLLTVGCDASAGPVGPFEAPNMRGDLLPASQVDTVLTRFSSGLETPGRNVIRTQAGWAELWERIHEHVSPTPERPEVDLDGHILVVAAMGSQPTGGYSIAIDAVSREGAELFVRVEERSPASNCTVTQALTSPVKVVRLPDLSGKVRFVEGKVTFPC